MNHFLIISFDQAILKLGAALGFSAIILLLIKTAFDLKSWYEGIGEIITGTKKAGKATAWVAHMLATIPPIRLAIALTITILVGIAQILTVGLCYIGGNFVTLLFDDDRSQLFFELATHHPIEILDPQNFWSIFSLNLVSALYVIVAVTVFITSYLLAFGRALSRSRITAMNQFMAWPAVLMMALFGAVLAIVTVIPLMLGFFGWFTSKSSGSQDIAAMLAYTPALLLRFSIGLVYYTACYFALKASALVAWAWMTEGAA